MRNRTFILCGAIYCSILAFGKAHGAVPQIAASDGRTLALKADGSLWAWGPNQRGTIGDGELADRWRPVLIGAGFIQIAAGPFTSFAIKADGSLWAWGSNEKGKLGDGGTEDRLRPVQIGSDFAQVTANWYAAYGIKRDGTLWSWGINVGSALGNGSTDWPLVVSRPTQVGAGYSAVHSSQQHVLALTPQGGLWGWGSTLSFQCKITISCEYARPVYIGDGYSYISAGEGFSLAIKKDGSLWGWGSNSYGNLGVGLRGTFFDPNPDPILGPSIDIPTQIFKHSVRAVTNGSFHSHAILTDGSLWGWGMGEYGALGDGIATGQNGTGHLVLTPKKIADDFWKTTLGGGNNNGFAIKHSGTVFAWGTNFRGSLGLGDTVNRLVPTPMDFNVFEPSGVTAGLVKYGSSQKMTIKADVSPNQIDAGKLGCIFMAAVLQDLSIFTYSTQQWGAHVATSPRAAYCGKLVTHQETLVQDFDTRPLVGTQVYLGYGVGSNPDDALKDMLGRGLIVQAHTFK